MTFYSVSIANSNISGHSSKLWDLVEGMRAFEANLVEAHWKNVHNCSECKLTGKFEAGNNSLWHTFRVREDIALKVAEAAEFKWKTKGIKNADPVDWLRGLVEAGTETWFTVDFYEV